MFRDTTYSLKVLSWDSPLQALPLYSSLGMQEQSVLHHSSRVPPSKQVGSERVTWCSTTTKPHTRMSCTAYQATGETGLLLGRHRSTSKAILVTATAQCLSRWAHHTGTSSKSLIWSNLSIAWAQFNSYCRSSTPDSEVEHCSRRAQNLDTHSIPSSC